jgi:enamine deaminase RidA (YjgF/YER057c/UK114 family)
MERSRIPSSSPYADRIGFSAAVRVGDRVLVSGHTAVGADGGVVGGPDAYLQAVEALRKVVEALERAGAGAADVVRTRMYITPAEHWPAVGRAHGEVFAGVRPAATMVVCALLHPDLLVEVEVEAVVGAA